MFEAMIPGESYVTAPDLSVTITHKAILQTLTALAMVPPPASVPAEVVEHTIAKALATYEGYSEETARTLLHNKYFMGMVRIIISEFRDWQAENNV